MTKRERGETAEGTRGDAGAYAGIRILDVSQGVAGPYCAMLFAQHGADVIKVEPVEGDWARGLGTRRGDHTVTELCANRGKRSLALNLRDPRARDILYRLVANADIFVESSRPGAAKRLGIDYPTLVARRRDLIYASFSGYGQHGPKAALPMTDTVAQAFSGLMALNRDAAGMPQKIGHYLIDLAAALYGCQALQAALYARRRDGPGRYLDINLMQAAAALQAAKLAEYAIEGGSPPIINVPAGCYQTEDGWIAVTLMREDQYKRMCTAIGRNDLRNDPRFTTFVSRARHASELTATLRTVFAGRTTEEWTALLTDADVMATAVLNYGQWIADPHVRAVNAAANLTQPGFGSVPAPVIPGILPPGNGDSRALAPAVGEHSASILTELGYGPEEIDALRRGQVIRS